MAPKSNEVSQPSAPLPPTSGARSLMIMPFDHRGTFEQKMFGIKGRMANSAEVAEIASYKRMIYEGFLQAVGKGLPKDQVGILVDEQFGSEILRDARAAGYKTACPAEKSGQDEFDFEYGSDFGNHIDQFHPTYVKVLVRYNPADDSDITRREMNRRQLSRLKSLSLYCKKNDVGLMFELLVVPTKAQLAQVGDDCARYDHELRPGLMIQAIRDIQAAGIEPALWKVEGIENEEQGRAVAAQVQSGGRKDIGLIILGRGESAERVQHWLKTAAHVPGFVGFAVGRTIFWEPLKALRENRLTREQAIEEIAKNYMNCCELWMKERIIAEEAAKAARSSGGPRTPRRPEPHRESQL